MVFRHPFTANVSGQTSCGKTYFVTKVLSKNSRETKAFIDLWNKVGDENEEAWASKVDKYVDEGIAEKEAKTKATEKLKSQDVKSFMKHYETLITHIRQLQNGAIHNVIMQDVDDFNKKRIW